MRIRIRVTIRLSAVALVIAFIGAGCTCPRTTNVQADYPAERAQIERRLQEVLASAESKDFERLDAYHLYGPKFTKFSGLASERLDATTSRQAEHNGLGAVTGLKMRTLNLKIDVFGNVGIATFVLDYNFDSGGESIHRKERSTIVFVKDGTDWRIAHEHLTPIQP